MKQKRVLVGVGVSSAIVLSVAAVAVLSNAFDRHLKNIYVGEEHVYHLDELPAFLTEELALRIACETLHRDGFDTNTWRPVPDDRSVAPDGRRDEYLVRNTIKPNDGSFTFEDRGGSSRYVHVELESNSITACVVIP